jgi:DNA-binding PadR family transcriptional regulator
MIKYALLGLLREKPDYGYHLRKRFEDRLGAVWRLNAGQVYQALQALVKTGLANEVIDDRTGADPGALRSRRLYALTAKGEQLLERWLQRSPARAHPVRDETLLRLLVIPADGHDEAARQIDKLLRVHRRYAARLLAAKHKLPASAERTQLVREISVEAALLHAEAHVKWLELAQRRLQESGAADDVHVVGRTDNVVALRRG